MAEAKAGQPKLAQQQVAQEDQVRLLRQAAQDVQVGGPRVRGRERLPGEDAAPHGRGGVRQGDQAVQKVPQAGRGQVRVSSVVVWSSVETEL